MVAVALGGIDQIDTQLSTLGKNIVDLRLAETFAPVIAELPGTDADSGYLQVGFAESAVFHARTPKRRKTLLNLCWLM